MENDDVEEEEEDDTEDADAEEDDRSQDSGACFVRACAVEMHFDISQEPLCAKIYWTCAIEMHFNISQEPLYILIYRQNAASQTESRTRTHILRVPAQSKCTSTFHKSHFIRKFTGKIPRPRLSPDSGHTLCARLHSRNTLEHVTRATLNRN